MSQYHLFFATGRTPTASALGVETIVWLPTFMISVRSLFEVNVTLADPLHQLAIATRLSQDSQNVVEASEKSSLVFYALAREALNFAVTVDHTHVHLITASVLIARYLGYLSRNNDSVLPLSLAYNMSLHRDGPSVRRPNGDLDMVQVEIRRRAWAMLYHLDRSIALDLGRPNFIAEDQVDIAAPANLDDDELGGPEHPFHRPTTHSYVIQRFAFVKNKTIAKNKTVAKADSELTGTSWLI